MKKCIVSIALLATALISNTASARDDQAMYLIKNALGSADAAQLDPSIKLYFGTQKHPAVQKRIGEWSTSKKSNSFARADEKACTRALISALLTMQERARKEGGNAVINIKSNYKNVERSSNTEYVCGSGMLMSGVAIKGTVVKTAR